MKSIEAMREHLRAHPSPWPDAIEAQVAACTCEVGWEATNGLFGISCRALRGCAACRAVFYEKVNLPCSVRLAREVG